MAWKKQIESRRRTRITMPQTPFKGLHITTRDVIQEEEISPDPWYWIGHRRITNRPRIGEDPLELRAVDRDYVRGTLPERIVFAKLLEFGLVEGMDFTFQSSMQGGRIELGGIVADFVFPQMKIIIQVQGRTHDLPLRKAKDEQQIDILAEMGYTTHELDDEHDIYDINRFEKIMRDIFMLGSSRGSMGEWDDPRENPDSLWIDQIFQRVEKLSMDFEEINRRI